MTKREEMDFVCIEGITQSILLVRARRVLLDSELAALYGVTTARLNQQVRRNLERFPGDFMFQPNADERNSLMLQFATSKPGRGGRRKLPLVFTEHGTLMAATLATFARGQLGSSLKRAQRRLTATLLQTRRKPRALATSDTMLRPRPSGHQASDTDLPRKRRLD